MQAFFNEKCVIWGLQFRSFQVLFPFITFKKSNECNWVKVRCLFHILYCYDIFPKTPAFQKCLFLKTVYGLPFYQWHFYENSTIFLNFSKQVLLNEQKYVVGFRENANTFSTTCKCNCPLPSLHQAFRLNDYFVI